MPKTKIEWTEHVWKVVVGCKYECPYCYVKRFDKQWNVPRFNEKVLDEPIKRKKPTMYFVANTGDLFGPWVPKEWIAEVIRVMQVCSRHTFQLLTKNPKRYHDYDIIFTNNMWAGTSVTKNADLHKILEVSSVRHVGLHYVSFEPLLEPLDLTKVDLTHIEWAIVGAESIISADNPKNVKASQAFAAPLIEHILKAGVPLFTKPNLKWPVEYKQMPKTVEQGELW